MVTWKQVVVEYGQEMCDKMIATGYLDAITVVRLPSGEADIPQIDIERAYRAANGRTVHDWD
jgi:hypothetical protein